MGTADPCAESSRNSSAKNGPFDVPARLSREVIVSRSRARLCPPRTVCRSRKRQDPVAECPPIALEDEPVRENRPLDLVHRWPRPVVFGHAHPVALRELIRLQLAGQGDTWVLWLLPVPPREAGLPPRTGRVRVKRRRGLGLHPSAHQLLELGLVLGTKIRHSSVNCSRTNPRPPHGVSLHRTSGKSNWNHTSLRSHS